MIALLQRVSQASVTINREVVGEIKQGLAVLVGIEKQDTTRQADRLLQRILGYRIFPDALGKMNLSLVDLGGGLLLVPQFTLAADTNKGMRPSFTPAADPKVGEQLFNYLVGIASSQFTPVATGKFGADMQVALINDGPVTFTLRSG